MLEFREFQPTWIGCAGNLISVWRAQESLEALTRWVAKQRRHDPPGDPFIKFVDVDDINEYEEWESPELAYQWYEGKFTKDLGSIGQAQHIHNMEDFAGDDQEIGFESIEANLLEWEGEVIRRRRHRCLKGQPQDVNRPEIVISHALP